MDQDEALRTTRVAGLTTLIIGTALLVAPGPAGAWSDIEDPRQARALGLADVACAVGLLRGRPLWPWATARAALNVVQAGVVVRNGPRGVLTAAALAGLAVLDGAAARELRGAGR